MRISRLNQTTWMGALAMPYPDGLLGITPIRHKTMTLPSSDRRRKRQAATLAC